MSFVLWLISGVILGLLGIVLARKWRNEKIFFGVALIIGGCWYVAVGVLTGNSLNILLPQIIGGLVFCVLGVMGLRQILFLPVGWTLHAFWDLASPFFSEVGYMPHWTVPMCLGFDLLVGCYLFMRYNGRYPLT